MGGAPRYDRCMSSDSNIVEMAKLAAKVRRANTPNRREVIAVIATCSECGSGFTRKRTQRMTICPACSRQCQIDAGRQNRAKEGPIWERTVGAQLKYWTSEARRLGIFYDDDEPA